MKKLLFALCAFAAVGLWMACEKNDSQSDINAGQRPLFINYAPFLIHMTDSPVPFDEVNVDIQLFRAKLDDGSWHNLNTTAGVYDLLQYQGGIDTTIVNDSLPTGLRIKELRIILGNNNTVVVDSVSHPLHTPSGKSSGVKIKLNQNPPLTDSLNQITIDFDACESIKQVGNGKYKLVPIIKQK